LGARRDCYRYEVSLELAPGIGLAVIRRAAIDGDPYRTAPGTEGDAGDISFYYTVPDGRRTPVVENIDAHLLSTQVAGGFVGTQLGLHARREAATNEFPSTNNQAANNETD
jgi:alpha-N-arabinofuranosidase